jgi:hypothetical protein
MEEELKTGFRDTTRLRFATGAEVFLFWKWWVTIDTYDYIIIDEARGYNLDKRKENGRGRLYFKDENGIM